MKKLAAILLAFVYFSAAGVVLLNVHYCAGKVSTVNIVFSDAKCACGKNLEKSGCCKSEHKLLKLNDAHKGLSNNIISQWFKQLDSHKEKSKNLLISTTSISSNPFIKSSPPFVVELLYQHYCVYRI